MLQHSFFLGGNFVACGVRINSVKRFWINIEWKLHGMKMMWSWVKLFICKIQFMELYIFCVRLWDPTFLNQILDTRHYKVLKPKGGVLNLITCNVTPPSSLTLLKHFQKILSVCRGHLLSMDFHPRNWERYFAYSSRVGGKLCLLIGVRTLPLLRSRHMNPPIHTPPDLHWVHDKICLVLYHSPC